MATPSVIKSDNEYQVALARIAELMGSACTPGAPEAAELELLTLLVETYERQYFPLPNPDPVDAIRFRMEQQDLAPRDLIPFIGSRSKVSEILARKRPLTLSMIRALTDGLGIPARVLIQESGVPESEAEEPDWTRFPVREMISRGWVDSTVRSIQSFVASLPLSSREAILCRKNDHVRSARSMDEYALTAWTTRIAIRAREMTLPPYKPGSVGLDFMTRLAKESASPAGPIAAQAFLSGHGVPLIIEPHLPHTHLDGAAILIFSDRPIIGMSIRHDRLDNFWFTLMHEVAHIALHYGKENMDFIDDLEVDAGNDSKERDADSLAGEALIPIAAWKGSPASRLRSPEAAQHLAKALGIHPAIVAGRMRHEWKAFRLLNNLVGHREVRRHFPTTKWD